MAYSAILAEELFLARLAIPTRFAFWFVVAVTCAGCPIFELFRAAIAVASIGFAITKRAGRALAAVFFAVFPFFQEFDVERIASNFAFVAPNHRDLLAIDSLNRHPHRACIQNDDVAHFKISHDQSFPVRGL